MCGEPSVPRLASLTLLRAAEGRSGRLAGSGARCCSGCDPLTARRRVAGCVCVGTGGVYAPSRSPTPPPRDLLSRKTPHSSRSCAVCRDTSGSRTRSLFSSSKCRPAAPSAACAIFPRGRRVSQPPAGTGQSAGADRSGAGEGKRGEDGLSSPERSGGHDRAWRDPRPPRHLTAAATATARRWRGARWEMESRRRGGKRFRVVPVVSGARRK